MTAASPSIQTTSWRGVLAGVFAGIAVAVQIGKVAAALPLIRAEFATSVALLSLYVALISAVGAAGGLAFGTVSRRYGPRRAGIAGLTLVALGSAAGAMAGGMPALLVTRLIEAFGFALAVTSLPAYVQSRAAPADRGLAMGLWSTWLPAGIALMMAIAWFWLDALGWRGIFWLCAAIPAFAALLLLIDPSARSGRAPPGQKTAARELLRGQAARTAAIFASFSGGYHAITAFLPTILFDIFAMPAPRAALVGFASALALIPGNIASGWLVGRGWHRRGILAVSLSGMIATAAILLTPGFGPAACVSAAIAFGAFSGAPPGVIWASIPILAPGPADAPIVSGAFFQSAAVGQVFGPILAGLAVEVSGNWPAAIWVVGAMLLAGLVLSLGIRREPARQAV